MKPPAPDNDRLKYAFLAGDAEFGNLIAGVDWATTCLGPLPHWSDTTRTTVALILRSPMPLATFWGKDGIAVFNRAYARLLGPRHAQLLGARVGEAWPEMAALHEKCFGAALAGDAVSFEGSEVAVERFGGRPELRLDMHCSPINDESGAVRGVLMVVAAPTAETASGVAARAEREDLHDLFEQAPGFMTRMTGPEHVFDLVNPAYQQLIGHRDVLGKPIREALPELEGQGFFESLDQVFASGDALRETERAVLLQRGSEGVSEERFVDFVYQPIRNHAGEVVGIFVQGTDVTERVRAVEALRASEVRFRTAAQTMPNHVWTATCDGAVDWFNERLAEYTGTPTEQIDPRGLADFVHPDDRAGATDAWFAALADGSAYEIELRLRRADGIYRWHLVRACPARNEDGAVAHWIGTCTDVEAQKTELLALNCLNSMLEELVSDRTADRDRIWQLSSDMLLVSDYEARVAAVNPAWAKRLGWQESDLIGRSYLDLVHPDDHPRTVAEMDRLREGDVSFSFENRYRRKDGGYSVLTWVAVPDEHFIHAVARDVTAEREAERVLRQTELALIHAQKMETIGRLTGGVAHDFNNLLQVISGNLQILGKDVAGDPRAERWVASALAAVRRGAKLSEQLLAFGRRQPLAPRTLNLGRRIVGLEDMLRQSLGEGVEIENIVPEGVWNAFVDPAQLDNAILNLAINARDAMSGVGKLTIKVGNALVEASAQILHTDAAPGEYVEVSVSDTGAGMTEDVLASAFEPFFTTKPEGMGTGLGLSMVYGFTKQSGGHAQISSELGQGTTVSLYLPRTRSVVEVGAPVDLDAVVGGDETILVAEDDADVRATVVEMLRELGYRVLEACDSAMALEVINSGTRVDLLFSDVVMPGRLRGSELARLARERLPQLAVLFTSGYPEDAVDRGGRLDVGIELLHKPYTREALARKVRQVLAHA